MLINKNKQRRFFLLLALLILSNGFFGEQILLGQEKTKIYIETDPSTFAFDGFAAHIRIAPRSIDHWIFGMGTYSMKFPNFIVNINPKNSNNGWSVKLKNGYGVFSDYYFSSAHNGWFVGGQLALQQYQLTNSSTESKTANYTTILFMPRVGYQWFPWEGGFYIMPWFGLGITSKISGGNKIDTKLYDIFPIMGFATLHIGYQF